MPPREVLDRLLRDRRCVARLNGSSHDLFPVAIGADEGEALRRWVVRENATHTIEVGLGYGIAALFVCELANGHASAHHVGIDPQQGTRFADCALQFVDDAGAVSFFTTNLGWHIEEASTDDDDHHWAVLRTARRSSPRSFDHYVEF